MQNLRLLECDPARRCTKFYCHQRNHHGLKTWDGHIESSRLAGRGVVCHILAGVPFRVIGFTAVPAQNDWGSQNCVICCSSLNKAMEITMHRLFDFSFTQHYTSQHGSHPHNADYEVCRNWLCRMAWILE